MELTQAQIDVQDMPLRKKYIKIELLNIDLQVLDSLEGYAIGGNITANANNTIRRSGDITLCVPIDKSATTFLDQINNMKISVGGKIWLDKRVKIYVGTETMSEGQTTLVWDSLGVFLIDKPVRIFSNTQYTISFNVVDQMVLLTGSRQGQLTGLGVEIPQFTNVSTWDEGLFSANEDAPYGVSEINPTNNEIISETTVYDGSTSNCFIATLASDKRTVSFYSKHSNGSMSKRAIGLPSQLSGIDLVSIHYTSNSPATTNFIALGTNGNIYLMRDEFNALYPTLTYNGSIAVTNILTPSMVYSTTNYYVATDNTYLYFIDKSTSAITRIQPSSFGDVKKFRDTSSALLFLYENMGGTYVGGVNLSTLAAFSPFSFYDILDFDVGGATQNYLILIRSGVYGGHRVYYYTTSDGGLSYSEQPIETSYDIDAQKVAFLKGPISLANYFVVCEGISLPYKFYLYNIENGVAKLTNSSAVNITSANYFNINFIEFIDAGTSLSTTPNSYLVLFGVGIANSITTTFFTIGYQIESDRTDLPQKTYDALSNVLSSLSLIKRFVIHPIEGDFEYLPYSIKVGTSATVWDIIDKFMQILSTWQAYFDINGVFRIEPIPSGDTALVYPLDSDVYISDQNDYDFNNVKNQVVVYGKPNEASFVATNVSLNANRNTLTLTFDNIDPNALGIKTTKFAFETGNMTPDVNINKIILESGSQWVQSTSSITYNYPTSMQYLDNAWYILSNNLYRSTDGETWNVVYSARINKIISNGSIYVGLGNQVIYYSEDSGETWAQATISGSLPALGSYLDVAYGNGEFRATFSNTTNGFATSSDGKNWTISASTAPYSSWSKIEYANGIWIGITYQAGADSGVYTYDGVQWGGFSTPDVNYYSLKYLNNKWFVGGSDGIYTSSDNGTTWTHITDISNIYPRDFAYGNGVYVSVVGNMYTSVYTPFIYSSDGVNWNRSPSAILDSSMQTVEYNGSAFIASGENGIYYSADGQNWAQIYNSNLYGVPMANSSNEIKIVDFRSSGGTNTYYVFTLTNPSDRVQITADFVSFEGSQNYVSSNEFIARDVYIIRFIQGSLDENEALMITRPLTMEYFSRLQPRWCLVDENTDSPFYINAGLNGENYYAGTAVNVVGADYGLRLKNFTGATLNDGTLITFMANKNNTENPTISVYNEDGSVQLVSGASLLGPVMFVYGTTQQLRDDFVSGKLADDYLIHLIKYVSSSNSFEYLGMSPSVYSLVLSGGEYDNIHSDRLAYERCLWELYSHTNLQDNLTLNTVPNFALDVNVKIPYDPANSAPIGTTPESESQFFLIKTITYPLGVDSTPQVINAIRIYDAGGLL